MTLREAPDLSFDQRLIRRRMRNGDLTNKEFAKHLDTLADCDGKAEDLDEATMLAEAKEATERRRQRIAAEEAARAAEFYGEGMGPEDIV